ncbi:NAD-dependent epimerase/dehydratase family protein [Pedobacter sp. Leaf132]|uniref:NAD-dependent epimerase/dehydratase family protein n=1 Tax=Pedobacter sp. Leaf132 TaxID=2876557 RepID=UPI001E4BFD7E|nr:NAD-dependent epimerase/dehydratase family protein [Pedobacter sp. Leaf132]
MTDKKWLIIGGGAVVQEYYLKAFEHLGLLNSITIIEPNPETFKILKEKKLNVLQLGFEAFLAETKVNYDYGIITLPNHLHETAIALCVAKNISVLCEKPLVLTTAACDKIIELEAETNGNVYTGMVRRYMPSYLALNKSLNLLGKIKQVNIEDGNPYAWVADSYAVFDPKNGGVLADMGVHYLDLVYHLFGVLQPVKYDDDYEGGVEANVHYILKNEAEIEISLKLSRTEKLKNTFEIIGANGKLWMEKDNFESCFFSSADDIVHEVSLNYAFSDASLQYVFEACFVEQIIKFSSNDKSLVKVEDAKAVITLIEWAYKNRKTASANLSKDSYLITGGTGFIGTALTERLWSKGIQNITVPVRGYKNCAAIARFNIDLPKVNLLNYETVLNIVKGKKFIVHLAYATDGKNAYNINVEATKNVVKAACEQGAEAVVVLSTMNVYGFPDGFVDENSNGKPAGGDYGKSKKIMQDWCLQFAKTQTKTRIIVLNPTCVYGPNGKTYTTLPITLANSNRFCWIDNGIGKANIVYIDNLLDAIEKSLSVKSAHGLNLIINDDTITWRNFLRPLLLDKAELIENLDTKSLLSQNFKEKTNLKKITRYLVANYEFVSLINQHPILGSLKKVIFKSIPKFRNKLNGEREIEWHDNGIENLRKDTKEPFNPPIWLNELFGNTKSEFSSKKAKEILGWEPVIPTEESLKITQEWLAQRN